MDHEPGSIALAEEDRRLIGLWAADCAQNALPLFEERVPGDTRPREAIAGIRAFAHGGKRTAKLRALAWAAFAAARESGDPVAAAAARAAGLAAAIAYVHALATPHQTKHTLGPAAYAALALERAAGGAPDVADAAIRDAIERASPTVRQILGRFPARDVGRGRLDAFLYQIDSALRSAG